MKVVFVFLFVSFCVQGYEIDGGRIHKPKKNQFHRLHDHQSTQGSIDDDFDCIDIYKQPAFQHPLLKNHKIQLFPTFMRSRMQNRSSYLGKAIKDENSMRGCRSGKVPIFKTTMRQKLKTHSSSRSELDNFNQYSKSYPGHHFATLDTTQDITFHGASARIGTYNLSIHANQYSICGFWIQSGPPAELNSIQVGSGIHPSLYGDHQIRLTAYWTADGYHKTGCFNHLCPGFVQVHSQFSLGEVLEHSSVIGSEHKYLLDIQVKQDKFTGHWWLFGSLDQIPIGYWPKQIFTHLSKGSSLIRYGGETFAPPNTISPPMGSGRLPQELFKNSGFIADLMIVDSNYNEVEVNSKYMKPNCDTTSNCYDALYHGYEGPIYRQAFLFGGPGGQCGI
ncbi:uncharacterized protein LOC130744929 [Lotus japonicus]|uniref:uncharacterized protein LOC130744929 n=1 Tax=Lotus japonicus TaxID=34305 RepID=UPI00258A770D|nr:uncharacterized protein LOC130744929 [Lotus japonicus]